MRAILTALQEGRLFELPEAGKDRALEFLARVLDANPDIIAGTDAVDEIKQREHQCNTGIGQGVAVPHIRAKREDGELFCAIGWSPQGIDYGADDGEKVQLVFMYYIPGAQKNVYLKEVSSLVKAMRHTGGVGPIAGADNLFVVRNLLLDWVSETSGDTGPAAVARMIRLEARQAQATSQAVPATPEAPFGAAVAGVIDFNVLVAPPHGALVLAQQADWGAALEKQAELAGQLAATTPFVAAGHKIFVTNTTAYPGSRVLYHCVAVMTAALPREKPPSNP